MAVLLAAPNAASAAPPAADAVPAGRVGLLPQPWVETLEAGNLSEQAALIAGGATVAAIGTGIAMAAAGATTGGVAGATLFTLWLAHIPIQMAVAGTGGYLAWSYLEPDEPATACEPPSQPVSTTASLR
ncbi:MAG TPA: hypothetical protein VIR38_11935 [Thalassobaculum sp.]